MSAAKDAEIAFVVGRRGSGKSTRVAQLIRPVRRVVAFDPIAEYGGIRCERIGDVRKALAANWGRGFRVSYVPPANYEMQAADELSRLLQRAQQPYFDGRDDRQITLVLEEADLAYPSSGKAPGALKALCLRGRHYGINIVAVSQRPTLVHPTLRGNARSWYVLPLDYDDDRREVLAKAGRQYADQLRTLQPHNFFHIRDGAVEAGKNPPLRRRK